MARRRTLHPARLAATALTGTALAFAATVPPASAQAAGSASPVDTTITQIASTVPANGDVNPYGVAVVPESTGALHEGNVLVSNFNAASNLQGTGTTIVQVWPNGQVSTFAQISAAHLPGACPGGIGLTTALVALRSGWVVVGSLPTADGSGATAKAGCLLVLDAHGFVRETLSGYGINGPWDMTALDGGSFAELFVSNVLNGTVAANGATVDHGTVLRLGLAIPAGHAPRVVSHTVIGSGFGEHTDPAALVVGPTGLGLAANGTLYVADSVGNRIAAIPNAPWRDESAGTGRTVTWGGALNTPLGLAVAPGGDILTVNAGDGFLVATTPSGKQVQTVQLDSSGDPAGAGALFGLATVHNDDVYFVDDAANTLNLLH
ncbi:MAG TPA: hypothetical protein VFA06_07950 [Actinocrinis sp.]|uniref:hypothetical protein n=1 Tax=Actinocrinis sp. TaxID=1920516 RepID=UPI002D3E7A97|nr:hypothetical protein [Actinocrinis sp.]HZU55785.1 hypothetical protein [Actinocrinis sp.]